MPESKSKSVQKPKPKGKKPDRPILSAKARELLFYAKLYRYFAFLAAFSGFVISIIIYNTLSGGEYTVFFERPVAVFNIIVPYIPCSILSMIAHSKKKKFYKQAESEGIDINALQNHHHLYSHEDEY